MKPRPKPKKKPGLQLGWKHKTINESILGFNVVSPNDFLVKKKTKRKPWHISEMESHLATIAPTGTGKGRSAIIPTCLSWEGSMVVIDPKGEAASVTARMRENLENDVVIIDPFKIRGENPATFNPFDIMDHTDMSIEEFSLLFPSLLHPDRDYSLLREPFWDLRGDDLIAGIVAYILSALPKEEQNMTTLRKLIKGGDVVYNLAVILDTAQEKMSTMAYENISAFISTEDKCRSGILATAQQHFAIYADPLLEKSLASTSFDLAKLKEGHPMTVYLVLPANRLASHNALLRIWMSSIIAILKSRTVRPQTPTLLMVDEAAQLGRMSALVECVTLLRGYGVRTWTFWQSKNQLEKIYGLDADVILDNCGVVQIFGPNNHKMAESLCGLFGQKYSAQDLLTLSRKKQLILTSKGNVKEVMKLDYLKDAKYKGGFDPNPIYGTPADEDENVVTFGDDQTKENIR